MLSFYFYLIILYKIFLILTILIKREIIRYDGEKYVTAFLYKNEEALLQSVLYINYGHNLQVRNLIISCIWKITS
jgi:hypothetical protein